MNISNKRHIPFGFAAVLLVGLIALSFTGPTVTTAAAPTTGSLTVNTVVVNDGGGTYDASNFPLHLVNWDTSTTMDVVSGQTVDLEPGLWRFLEIASPLYQAHYSGDCSEYDNVPPGGPFPENGRGFVVIAAGEMKNCTLTNNDWPVGQVLVKKEVINDEGGTGKPEDFILTVTSTFGAYNFPGTSTSPFGPLYAGTVIPVGTGGTYNVLEASHPGYFPSFSGDCSGTVSWGELKHCTVTNDDTTKGRITVHISVINNSGGNYDATGFYPLQIINWDTSSTIPVVDGQTVDLDPGNYRFLQTASMFYGGHWSGDCTEYDNPIPGAPTDGSGRGFFVLAAGDIKSCTITNDDIAAGYMLVKKEVINDEGGTGKPEDFILNVSSTLGSFSFNGTSTSPNGPLYAGTKVFMGTAGTYVTTEPSHPGYFPSFSPECSGTVNWGELKHCTVTNDDTTKGRITVHINVINDDGGNYDATNFYPLQIINWDTSATTPVVDGQTVDLDPGNYRFLETASSFYQGHWSGDCSEYDNPIPGVPNDGSGRGFFNLTAGDIKSCTITNNDTPAGTVLVKKIVINDNGGTKDSPDFTLYASSSLGLFTFQGTSTSPLGPLYAGTKVFVSTNGTYEIGEVPDAGYTATFQGDCSGTVGFGEMKYCTVTNDDVAPNTTGSVTVHINVINDSGGNYDATNFYPLRIINWDTSTTIPVVDGQTVKLAPGNYRFLETASMFYRGQWSGDCSEYTNPIPGAPVDGDGRGFFHVDIGDTKSCTITNDDVAAGIVMVKKLVVNDNGGTKDSPDFTLYASSSLGYFPFQGTSTSPLGPLYAGTKTFVSSVGTFEIGEISDAGYTATYEGDCSGTIAWGTALHCNVINNDIGPAATTTAQTATLIVRTVVINTDGGWRLPSDFQQFVTGTNPSVTSFIGDASGTVIAIEPGAYSVNEVDPALYTKSLSTECSGTIAAGQTIVCTITNDDQPTTGGGGTVGGGGGSGGSGGGATVPPTSGSGNGPAVGGGSPPPGKVLGAVDEESDPGSVTTGSSSDPSDPSDPSAPTELPRTGLPIGYLLLTLLPLSLYATRRKS